MQSAPSNRNNVLKVEKKQHRPRSVSTLPSDLKANSSNHSNRKLASATNARQSSGQKDVTSSFDLATLKSKEPTTIINQQKYLSSPTTRLLIVSSKCKNAAVLEKSVNSHVTVVLYNHETVSFNSLLALICASLETNQRVSSVACMLTSKPNGIVMVHHSAGLGILEAASVLSHKYGPGQFFKILFERFVDTKSVHCRLDLLAVGSQPGPYVDQLAKLIGVPVYVSKEPFGSDTFVNDFFGGKKVTVGEIYFKPDKLRNWSAGSYQSIELFEKIRMVGKGNFGTAVLYKKKDDNSLVVLKEINMTELNSQERSMAINEAKVLSLLNHPNIICYYDTFEENGVLMIEMEYADDGTLSQFLSKRDTPLDEPTILSMFAQIVSGITYMHKEKILHRDLKTANIFLTTDGCVKIGDFGVAKVMSSNYNVANTVLGTPYYISPEICEGKPYNEKSDIWALGCILYEMATRQRTFEGTNLPALVNKIMNGQIAPIRGDYSADFRRLVKEMLHKDPEQRPTAEELDTNRIPELRARHGQEEHSHCVPGSRNSSERKLNEGNRSVLYLYNTSTMMISVVDGLPSKIKIRQISVGDNHVVVVAMERIVYTWGENTYGQLGHGHLKSVTRPLPVDALKGKSIVSASCGANFSVFLSDNGIAMTCGDGRLGCLGHGDLSGASRPRLIEALLSIDVTTVACGFCHVVVLGSRGEVYSWGCGAQGRLGLGSEDDVATPTRVNISQPVRDVRCGHDATVFITEVGTLLACGSNKFNKLGLNERTGFLMAINHRFMKTEVEYRKTPTVVKPIKGLVDVSVGRNHTVVLTDRDQVYVLGSNKEGQMGSGDNKTQSSPYLVKGIKDYEATIVACGNTYTVVGTSSGHILYWGTRFGQATGNSDGFLQPPTSVDGHKRSLSTSSTLSLRSFSSNQQDPLESVSRTPSYADVSADDADSGINSSVSASDSRLPEGVYTPIPILNIRSSPDSTEDLSAFLDNLIPYRENVYILVETNAPLTSQTSIKEKRKKSLKNRLTMQSLKVPFPSQSFSSNDSADNGSPEVSDLSATPEWLQQELEDARKQQEDKEKPVKLRLKKSASAPNWNKKVKSSLYNPSLSNNRSPRKSSAAKSDSSSDSSAMSQLTVESARNHRASVDSTRGRRKDSSPRPSPTLRKSNRLYPDRSAISAPVRRTSSGKSPVRSHAKLNEELDRLLKEKQETDEKLKEMKREHKEMIERLRESHEKERLEQEQKMKDQISYLREELDVFMKRQMESKQSSNRTESKLCSVQ